jgi:hypothetical protein
MALDLQVELLSETDKDKGQGTVSAIRNVIDFGTCRNGNSETEMAQNLNIAAS